MPTIRKGGKETITVTGVQVFEEVFRQSASNAAAVTAGSLLNVRTTERVKQLHAPFNSIYLRNLSTEELQLLLDGDTNNQYNIPPSSTFFLSPEEGNYFTFFDIKNTDAAAQVEIGEIQYRYSKSIVKGRIVPAT